MVTNEDILKEIILESILASILYPIAFFVNSVSKIWWWFIVDYEKEFEKFCKKEKKIFIKDIGLIDLEGYSSDLISKKISSEFARYLIRKEVL